MEERFKKPTDQQYVDFAILLNDGKMDAEALANMIAMAELMIDRLHEHGDVGIKSSKEIQIESDDRDTTTD